MDLILDAPQGTRYLSEIMNGNLPKEGFLSMRLKTPELFFSPKVLILKDEATKTNRFEVYHVFNTETKDLLYIGSGKKDRHRHVFSGASQNVSLNVCMICSVPITITVKGIASKEESLTLEAEEIKRLNPKFNGRFMSALDLSEISVEKLGETLETLLSKKEPSLKTLCQMYQEDSIAFSQQHPDWYEILQEITPEVCASYGYKKIEVKKLFKAKQSLQAPKAKPHIYRVFKVGKFYSSKYIKTTLTNLGIQGAKATTLKKWFELKSCTRKGVAGYEVIRKVPNS